MLLRLLEAGIDACALDGVAGRAACDEIARILLSFARSRNHEIHAHGQSILESGPSVQTAILANVLVALEDFAAFFERYRGIHQRKRNDADRHEGPPRRKSSNQEGKRDFRAMKLRLRARPVKCAALGVS